MLLLSFAVSTLYPLTQPEVVVKKKIVILSSIGGGGQIAINEALHQTLKDVYDVKTEQFFTSADPVSFITFKKYKGEDFYNYAQKKQYNRLLQALYEASRWYYSLLSPLLIKQTIKMLKQEKPDLVISIIPIVNNIVAKSCKRLNIPLLIIPADLDVGFYTSSMKPPYSKNLYIALPFDNPMSRTTMKPAKIPESNIFSFQYPLRKDFYTAKNVPRLKKEFNITDNRPVVLLMMGAQGSEASFTFSKELTKASLPIHLIICIGKNEDVRKKIEALEFPKEITPQIIGYTDRIADIMAISDIMISKTGAISVIESIYSDLPIIADQTEHVLSWELMHQTFLAENKCGLILKDLSNLIPTLENLLNNPSQLDELKKNIARIKEQQPTNSIEPIIEKIIHPYSTLNERGSSKIFMILVSIFALMIGIILIVLIKKFHIK